MENEKNKQIAEEQNGTTYRNLAVFSFLLVVVPLSIMYISNGIFKGEFFDVKFV